MDLKLNSKNEAILSKADIETLKKAGAGVIQVKVSHILVPTQEKAREIYDEIMANSDMVSAFTQAAQKYSTCPSKQNGGDLGWFGVGQMVPEFETAAFSMLPGEVKTDVVTQFGTHLLFKEDERLFLPIKEDK